mmetsp:Transcript_19115/g.36564  ORF Transcript_19115/g.36564 Transcript_19115/m.36564 type:complete len:213 (-) Transcript_19115:517-1155(-)
MGCGSSSDKAPSAAVVPAQVEKKPVVDIVVPAADLHGAIRWERMDEVTDIIKKSPSTIDLPDEKNGNTALHIAAQNGHMNLVELIVKAKCNVNAQNGGGQTAMHMAMSYDMKQVVDYLREHGADDSIKNNDGHPAKFGLGGEKDPSCVAFKISSFKAAATEQEFIAALEGLRDSEADRASVVQTALAKKKEFKDEWKPNVQTVLTEVMGTLK